ncbi:cytochrome P450 4C1-like [Phymastichus coffea]|uniref:cytochrome P450 4C1-like n=1 Tax=Phymastichus coffea TaxID=108790 RepID=UPI00273BF2B3|nr:cytochrome P450 4C1-like [Phymastichus coffea]
MSESSKKMWRQTIYPTRDSSYSYFDTTSFLIITSFFLTTVWILKKAKALYKERTRMIKLAAKLPGPPTLPILGNALQFACKPEETLNKILENVNNYDSPMRFWLGPKLFIILTEPQDYEVILGCQKASYKDPVYRFMEPFVGQGLVSGSGPMHRTHRRVIMPMLNNKVLNEYVAHFDAQSRICTDLLNEKVGCEAFDIQPFLIHCTFDIIFDTILGLPGISQKEGHKELVYWTEQMYELIHLRMMKVWLHPDWIFYRTALAKRQHEGQKVIHGFIESAVARKKKEHYALERGAIASDRPRLMLLEQIIDYALKNDFLTDDQIRDHIYTLFTAAQDTTAVISSFALLNLAMNQEIQDKLREEIKKVIGDENVRIEHLPELKYMEMVIKETLRLYPIAPMMVRQVTGDIDLETCTLPKGCSIVMVPFATHRSEKFWMDPEKFIPERFLPENSNTRHPYAYIPFSGGLRGCIGQKYAIMALKTILAHVVRRFRLTTMQKLETLRLKTDISIRSRDGYMVTIHKI